MASTIFQFADDAWRLRLDDTLNVAQLEATVSSPYSVVTSVEYVRGTCLSGIFVASAISTGQRDFVALVVDVFGNLWDVEGVLDDDGTDVTISSATPTLRASTVVVPVGLAVTAVGVDATWYYNVTTDVIESFMSTVGFTAAQAGVLAYYPSEIVAADSSEARHDFVRIINNDLPNYPTVASIELELGAESAADSYGAITTTVNTVVHGIIGAQLGDMEFDIGKTVPWTSHFVTDVFITDINIGRPRYWVVDWGTTFKAAKVTSLAEDFFSDPVAWRRAQFAAGDLAWSYKDDDWVLFMDGHEGLSCDIRSLPDDVGVNPFGAFIQREIQRAVDLDEDWASFPFFAFVRTGDVQTQTLQIQDPVLVAQRIAAAGFDIEVEDINTSVVLVGVPYYYQRAAANEKGLVRLVKVAALRDPDFDWMILDTLSTPSTDVKLQVVSYGYAHWNNPETGLDDGFDMRLSLSQVRSLLGLPVSGTDATGTAGPYRYGDVNGQVAIDSGSGVTQGLLTPMYSAVFRDNPRDGIWYLPGELGLITGDVFPMSAFGTGTALDLGGTSVLDVGQWAEAASEAFNATTYQERIAAAVAAAASGVGQNSGGAVVTGGVGIALAAGETQQADAQAGSFPAAVSATAAGIGQNARDNVSTTPVVAAVVGVGQGARTDVIITSGTTTAVGVTQQATATGEVLITSTGAGAATGAATESVVNASPVSLAAFADGEGEDSNFTVLIDADLATATGGTAVTQTAVSSFGGTATATGDTSVTQTAVSPSSGTASAAGTGQAPTPDVQPLLGSSSATGTANNPTQTVASGATAASAAGVADTVTSTVASGASAASAAGLANNATVTVVVSAIAIVNLLSNGTGTPGASSQATASASCVSGRRYLVAAMAIKIATLTPATPTLTGWGQTWALLATADFPSTGGTRRRMWVWHCTASSSTSGALTFSGLNTPESLDWIVDEITGSTGYVSGNVQIASDADLPGSTMTENITMNALASSNNRVWTVVGINNSPATPNRFELASDVGGDADWTQLGFFGSSITRVRTLASAWRNGSVDLTPGYISTAISGEGMGQIGIEISS